MVRSMTGFGRYEATNGEYAVSLELKSVNHRFLDVSVRVPRQYALLEEVIRKSISERLTRGHIDAHVTVRVVSSRPRSVQVDMALAAGYSEAIGRMCTELGLQSDPGRLMEVLTRLPDVLRAEEVAEDLVELSELTRVAASTSLDMLLEMRSVEGNSLTQDLTARLDLIAELVSVVSGRAPLVVEDYRKRLTDRIQELLPDSQVDPSRLATEVALFADRSNITEELVRLASHISQFRTTLDGDGAVGRRLDFLLQEMFREINTIGSKANDFEIATNVVTAKTELEKIREQVQNIE